MSSGPFALARYQNNNGDVLRMRVQPETIALTLGTATNGIASGAITPGFPSAILSRSRRSIGVHARRVTVRVTAAGTSGLSVGSVITLPWFVRATFDSLPQDATGTYNGASVVLIGSLGEKTR